MNFLLAKLSISQDNRQILDKWLIMLAGLLIVYLMEVLGISMIFLSGTRQLTNPLLRANVELAAKVNKLGMVMRQQQQLARRVQDLEIRLSQSLAQLGEIDQLREENQELRQLLNSTDRSLGRVVLTRPILSFAQPVVSLPVGEVVAEGSAVLVHNTLIGLIKENRGDVAVIELLWQNANKPVLAVSESGAQGVVVGDGRRVLLTEVPIEEVLEVGQRVVSAGQQGVEQGLFIGEVRSLETGSSAAVKTAVLEQHVSFYGATMVEIRL